MSMNETWHSIAIVHVLMLVMKMIIVVLYEHFVMSCYFVLKSWLK